MPGRRYHCSDHPRPETHLDANPHRNAPPGFQYRPAPGTDEEVRKCKDNKAIYQVGIEWCTAQSKDLLAHGAPAIHYYTMGKADNIREILKRTF